MENGIIKSVACVWLHGMVAFAAFMFLVVTLAWIAFFIKRWRRRRKADRRIIAQAKGAGVWDKKPIVLGGRALELLAWQNYNIKRKPGETDKELRRRCIAATDNEPAIPTPSEMERHDELDAYLYAIRSQISKATGIPPEILYGGSKTDTKNKGESENE